MYYTDTAIEVKQRYSKPLRVGVLWGVMYRVLLNTYSVSLNTTKLRLNLLSIIYIKQRKKNVKNAIVKPEKQGLGQKLKQSLQSVVNKTYHYTRCLVENTVDLIATSIAGVVVGVLIVGVYLSNPVSAKPLDERVDRLVCKLDNRVRKYLEK